jgi:hypothetical protein
LFLFDTNLRSRDEFTAKIAKRAKKNIHHRGHGEHRVFLDSLCSVVRSVVKKLGDLGALGGKKFSFASFIEHELV